MENTLKIAVSMENVRKESFELLRREVNLENESIKKASNNEIVIDAINTIEEILKMALESSYMEDTVAAIIKDILDTIPAVRTFDFSHASFIKMNETLLSKIDRIIVEEKNKEKVEKLRNIFY